MTTTLCKVLTITYTYLVISQATTYPRSKFKAAVYEHKVILPKYSNITVSRQEALSLMYKNLDVYRIQAEAAREQDVDILVFPEDGVYGMMFRDRKYVMPYLEYIPDPQNVIWNPCKDPEMYENTEVQHTLSCLAKNNSIYLVANMGDKQPCDIRTDPHCPHDGRYQMNTDVVYDPNGTLISKYHKENLFLEFQFDKPKEVELIHFETPFGKFGVFTCFDILFNEPSITLIEKYDIGNIVFPTAWMDALPLLAGIQFHSSFSVKMGVNLLSANIHLPIYHFHGSGIYTPDGGATFYYNNYFSSGGKLVISEINVVNKTPHNISPDDQVLNKTLHKISPNDQVLNKTLHKMLPDDQVLNKNLHQISPDDQFLNQTSNITQFKAKVFHDLYNFVQVVGTSGDLSVCHNKLCCHLIFKKENMEDALYAFGAFDGLHTYDGHYYLQICTLLRCANLNKRSCGRPVMHSKTKFSYLRIDGSFGTPYVFPSVLLTNARQLELAPKQWRFNKLVLESTTAFDFPLLSANLFGRVYNWDDDVADDANFSDHCSDVSGRIMFSLLSTVAMFVLKRAGYI